MDEALRVLHRYSLIDHDRASRYREIRVHQLIQRATRENFTTRPGQQDPTPLTVLARAAASALTAVWPEAERDELGQVLRASATALIQHSARHLWNPCGHVALFRLGRSLGEAGLVTDAIDYFRALHATATHQLGSDHPDTLRSLSDLIVWRGKTGDAAAQSLTSNNSSPR